MLYLSLFCLAIPSAPSPGPSAVVRVEAATVLGTVDPRFFGLFTEHIGDALDGRLPAEKLRGRGFESGDANGDGVGDPWLPWGDARFAVDGSDSMPRFADGRSSRSQRIELAGGPAGLRQTGLAVEAGDPLTVSLFVRATGRTEGLHLALRAGPGEEPLAEATIADLPGAWTRVSATLAPTRSAFPCALEIAATGEGAVWLDQTSALPASQVGGWRTEVVGLYEWLRPATLRYPGGNVCQSYHFEDGLGPVELRPVVPNPAWGAYPEPNHIGTDEFLGLCERVGMEPILCLNIGDTGGRNPLPDNSSERALRESIAWLQYANGDTATEWGAKRAANGHPAPYGVRLWEVGNEIGYGHIHGQLTKEQYAARFVEFARALRAEDPTIELIACGYDPDWNRLLMREGRDLADFVAIHTYDNLPMPADTAAHAALYIGPWLDAHIRALREGGVEPGTVRLAANEWSYSWAHWGGPERAVAAAGFLHECLRRADWVAMTNNSDAVVRFRNNEQIVFPDSECLGMALLAHHTGREVLATEVAGPTFETLERGAAVAAVDALASREGERLFVSLLNRGAETVRATVDLTTAGTRATGVAAWGVRPTEPGGRTSFETPRGLAIVDLPAPGDGPLVEVDLPPMSPTVLLFRCEGEAAAAPRPVAVEGVVEGPSGPLSGATAQLVPTGTGEPVTARTDDAGRFRAEVAPGVYRLFASAEGHAESAPEPVLASPASRAERRIRLAPLPGEPFARFGPEGLEASGFAAASWEGAAGSATCDDSGLRVVSPPDSRYGALSAPIDLGDDEALVLEAHIVSFTGINALLHLTTEGREGQFSEFLEVGVERGHAVAWGPGLGFTGPRTGAPATLRAVIGPRMPSGRTVELFVNGELVQRASDQAWLNGRRVRVLLYGYGEGERHWDWVRLRRVPVARRVLFEDPLETLDTDRWQEAAVVGTAGSCTVGDGALTIHGALDSRYGLLTDPLPQGPSEVLVASARLVSHEGHNGLLCLLGGGVGDFTAISEAGIERGLAQAWIGDWSRATERVAGPAVLRVVAGPARPDGSRRVRVYVNDRLVSASPAHPEQQRPLRLFLYGWSTATTVWDDVRVELIDVGELSGEMVAADGAVG